MRACRWTRAAYSEPARLEATTPIISLTVLGRSPLKTTWRKAFQRAVWTSGTSRAQAKALGTIPKPSSSTISRSVSPMAQV
jgi:hypothetical protein